MDGMAGRKSSLVWAVNISALLLVILWTIPTLGLFVSSFRDRDQIASSGWWQSFSASEQTGFVRTGTDKDAEQRDGLYIIEGNVLEGGQSLVALGTGARQPAEFQPGETTRIEDGWDLTVNEDGSSRLTSARP
ncbi:MAG: carbohydrate ABC transporter permease, partial [Paracoccus sp. (in: a-proteobacteria)]